jgi:hypothetical protein
MRFTLFQKLTPGEILNEFLCGAPDGGQQSAPADFFSMIG